MRSFVGVLLAVLLVGASVLAISLGAESAAAKPGDKEAKAEAKAEKFLEKAETKVDQILEKADTAPVDDCPAELAGRTPDQVVADLRAARAAEDWEAYACNYDSDAFVVDDQGILIGRDEIVASAMSWVDLFCDVQPAIRDEIVFQNVVRATWELDGGWIIVPDGTNTYQIENGQIVSETLHALIEFTGPPPTEGPDFCV